MQEKHTGRFLGIPYDWRRPTWQRVKDRWWNPDSDTVINPKAWGWGYSFNLHALLRRMRILRERHTHEG